MSADGPVLQALNAAAAMIRDNHQFRRLADPNNPWNQATAEQHVHIDALPKSTTGADHSLEELKGLRPFALIWADTAGGHRIRNDTMGGCVLNSGSIILQLEYDIPSTLDASDPAVVAEDAYRKVGRFMRTNDTAEPGLLELSHLAGYLPIIEIQFVGVQRTNEKDAISIGDAMTAEFQISWGLE